MGLITNLPAKCDMCGEPIIGTLIMLEDGKRVHQMCDVGAWPITEAELLGICYFCGDVLTSDDYKVRGVITSFSGQVCHEKCFDKQNVADCFPCFGVDEETEGAK